MRCAPTLPSVRRPLVLAALAAASVAWGMAGAPAAAADYAAELRRQAAEKQARAAQFNPRIYELNTQIVRHEEQAAARRRVMTQKLDQARRLREQAAEAERRAGTFDRGRALAAPGQALRRAGASLETFHNRLGAQAQRLEQALDPQGRPAALAGQFRAVADGVERAPSAEQLGGALGRLQQAVVDLLQRQLGRLQQGAAAPPAQGGPPAGGTPPGASREQIIRLYADALRAAETQATAVRNIKVQWEYAERAREQTARYRTAAERMEQEAAALRELVVKMERGVASLKRQRDELLGHQRSLVAEAQRLLAEAERRARRGRPVPAAAGG